MPGYTFRCRKCGGLTEVVHGFSEPHPTTCKRMVETSTWSRGPMDR